MNHLGNVLTTIRDYKIPVDIGSDNTVDYFTASLSSANDYFPFGAPMNSRSFNSDSTRHGFNSQEKVNEVSGSGNHNTAEFWEMDTRLGRRWNLDRVKKSWQSDYVIFSDSPIWKIDPDGNDDYYNNAGKYVGSDGAKTTEIRLVTSKKAFEAYLKEGIETLQAQTRVVTLQENTDQAINAIYTNSVKNKVEQKAYIILDTKNATLGIEVQPQGPEDAIDRSTNEYDVYTSKGDKQKYKSPKGDAGDKIIVGQIHGHPGKELGGNTISGPSMGKDDSDESAANELGVPVYPVDKESIYKIDSKGNTDSFCKDECAPILRDALETSGGKTTKNN